MLRALMNFESATTPRDIATAAFGLIILRWGTELFLAKINEREVRRNADKIPDAYKETIDSETYRKSVEYTLARNRFGIFQEMWNTLVLLFILFAGVLPDLFEAAGQWLGFGIWGAATTLFGIGIVYSLIGAPWDFYDQFWLEERFGFNTTTKKTWLIDRIKALMIGTILGIPIIGFLLKMVEISGPQWWIWAWTGILAIQAVLMLLAPAVILPLFNKFSPLPDGELKDRLRGLAKKNGFTASNIHVMDGSKRSRHSNAFFTGFGRFRRIVLFDTLIEQLNPSELEAVLAHEIGHYKLKHIPKILITSAVGLLVSFFVLSVLLSQSSFYEAFGFSIGSVAPGLLVFFLLSGTVSFWISPLMNRLSRKHEYEADAFAVGAVGSAEPLISSLRKLSEKNLSNLTPHPVYSAFYYSHPTLTERENAMQSVCSKP